MKNFIKSIKNVTLSTWIRTALMVIALVNMVLEICGKSILPISNEQVSQFVTYVFTAIVFVVNWWKNNSFTLAAQKADEILKESKNKIEDVEETEGV